MSRSPGADDAILDDERRAGRIAGSAALLSIVAMVLTVVVAGRESVGTALPQGPPGSGERAADRAQLMLDFHDGVGAQAAAVGLRCVGLVLMIVIGLHLFRLTRTRDARVARPAVLWLTVIAPLLVVATTIAGFLAFQDVADAFASSGPRTPERATQLVDDSTGLAVAEVTGLATRLVAGVWLALLALAAMRVGLLTRFLGYLGVAAGVAVVLLPGGDALVAGWIASVGLLALGYWPGGRPAAWSTTEPQEIEAV